MFVPGDVLRDQSADVKMVVERRVRGQWFIKKRYVNIISNGWVRKLWESVSYTASQQWLTWLLNPEPSEISFCYNQKAFGQLSEKTWAILQRACLWVCHLRVFSGSILYNREGTNYCQINMVPSYLSKSDKDYRRIPWWDWLLTMSR